MSKILEASCVAGIVTADGLPVPATEVLSEGVASSEGVLILDEGEKFYLAKTSPDLQAAIVEVVDALDAISSSLTQIAANMLGPATAPPPGLPAQVILINNAKTALDILKENLR